MKLKLVNAPINDRNAWYSDFTETVSSLVAIYTICTWLTSTATPTGKETKLRINSSFP